MRLRVPSVNYRWAACACALAACSENQLIGQASVQPTAATASAPTTAGSRADVPSPGRGGGFADAAPQLTFKQGATEYLGALTARTGSNAYDPALNLVGTDLGISFTKDNKLYFLFGDSWMSGPFHPNQGRDPLGWTELAAKPAKDASGQWILPKLNWQRDTNNEYRPFTFEKVAALPGAEPVDVFNPMKEMSVPVEAVTVNDQTYIFVFHSSGKVGEMPDAEKRLPVRSILARADQQDLTKLTVVHEAMNTNFLSVSTVRKGDEIFIYGAGDYRRSGVYLAKVAANTLTDRNTWQYYYGSGDWRSTEYTESARQPGLLPDQQDNPPSGDEKEMDAPCVGEISVRKHPTKELYFMAYNCGTQVPLKHRVQLRVAQQPEGPWSRPQTILTQEDGFGVFVHRDPAQDPMMKDDMLAESDLFDPDGMGWVQPRLQGDVYGPYLIPEWFSDLDNGEIELTYTISSWQPYQVHLIHTKVSVTAANAP